MMNNCRVKIAVLLAAYNGASYIEQQIETILNQSFVDVDVYISLDKSTDDTEAKILALADGDSRIKILTTDRIFGGAAPNFFRLIRDVCFDRYDYVSLSDQDDLWFSDKLIRAHDLLVKSNADGYSSNVVAFWADGRQSEIEKSQPQKKWDFLFEAAGPGCTYVMSKALSLSLQNLVLTRWDQVQSIALHDWLAYAFARANGYKWVIDDRIGMAYRQHSSNQVGVNAGWRAFKYRVSKVMIGWGTHQASLITSVLDLDDTPFVRRWKSGGRLGLLWLALNANQCRRKKLDRVYFALSCIALAILGRTHKQ